MPSLTIRNLQPETKDELRRRAISHGHSMQDEARLILHAALAASRPAADSPPITGRVLYELVRAIVEPIGGIDIELPPRGAVREPPSFD